MNNYVFTKCLENKKLGVVRSYQIDQ